MAGLVACSNLSEKRTLLAAAGFKTIPATTPAQLAKLNSLKSGKVVPLVGKNGTVYVFADTARKALLAGNASQYEAYRKLKVSQQKIDAKAGASVPPAVDPSADPGGPGDEVK